MFAFVALANTRKHNVRAENPGCLPPTRFFENVSSQLQPGLRTPCHSKLQRSADTEIWFCNDVERFDAQFVLAMSLRLFTAAGARRPKGCATGHAIEQLLTKLAANMQHAGEVEAVVDDIVYLLPKLARKP
jgi:hypothetical protein